MTDGVTIVCKTADGKPLDVLAKLIEERTRLLGETTKDAVVATAIDALKSIRAATSVARPTRAKVSDVQTVDWTGSFVPGWYKDKTRCVRKNGEHGNYFKGMTFMGFSVGVKNIMGKYKHGEKPRVIWAKYFAPWLKDTIQGNQRYQGRVGVYIAPDEKTVKEHVIKSVRHRIKRHASVSRNVIGLAMKQLSTRAPALKGEVQAIAGAFHACHLSKKETPGGYSVTFISGLESSLGAVKGGEAGVTIALKKAANKVYGLVAHRVRNCWQSLTQAGFAFTDSPFPEVKR